MVDIIKQIAYWKECSISNLETAEILISKKKYVEGLFFSHLSIEKILKALVVKATKEIPPKSHNLEYLSKLAEIDITDEQKIFMSF
jgi:HEPN domain-containing protein